jgi:hypothetical protein
MKAPHPVRFAVGISALIVGVAVLNGRFGTEGIPHQGFNGWGLVLAGALWIYLSLRAAKPTQGE